MKATLKRIAFGVGGRRPRPVRLGLYRGLTLSLDPACETGLLLGLYEAESTAWLREAGRQARSLIDVGAGYGELTLWALGQPQIERVLAYDPKPERWPVFRDNLQLNGRTHDPRLTAVEGWFLGEEDSSSVAAVFSDLPGPVLVKIDVDGGEEAILQRMQPLLPKLDLHFLLETHSADLDAACHRILESSGYEVTHLAPAWWRTFIRERRPIEFNQWLVARPRRSPQL